LTVGAYDVGTLGVVGFAVVVELAGSDTHAFDAEQAVTTLTQLTTVAALLLSWFLASYREISVVIGESAHILIIATTVAVGRTFQSARYGALAGRRCVGSGRGVSRRRLVFGRVLAFAFSVDV
jgi:hypothetical protein